MAESREDRYRRYARWYPRDWRSRNGDALIGALTERAEARQDDVLEVGELAALILEGLRQRFAARQAPTRRSLAVLVCSTVFAVWYASVAAWAPAGPRYSGYFGPFSNPMIIVTALLLGALALSIVGHARLARLIAWISAGAALLIGCAAAIEGWMGPSVPTTALFVVASILAAVPWSRTRSIVLAAAVGFGVCLLTEWVGLWLGRFGSFVGFTEGPTTLVLGALAASGLIGVTVFAWRLETPPEADDASRAAPRR